MIIVENLEVGYRKKGAQKNLYKMSNLLLQRPKSLAKTLSTDQGFIQSSIAGSLEEHGLHVGVGALQLRLDDGPLRLQRLDLLHQLLESSGGAASGPTGARGQHLSQDGLSSSQSSDSLHVRGKLLSHHAISSSKLILQVEFEVFDLMAPVIHYGLLHQVI